MCLQAIIPDDVAHRVPEGSDGFLGCLTRSQRDPRCAGELAFWSWSPSGSQAARRRPRQLLRHRRVAGGGPWVCTEARWTWGGGEAGRSRGLVAKGGVPAAQRSRPATRRSARVDFAPPPRTVAGHSGRCVVFAREQGYSYRHGLISCMYSSRCSYKWV